LNTEGNLSMAPTCMARFMAATFVSASGPHNAAVVPTTIADFHPSDALRRLTAADIRDMTPEQFTALFRHSAVRRTKLAGLQAQPPRILIISGVTLCQSIENVGAGCIPPARADTFASYVIC